MPNLDQNIKTIVDLLAYRAREKPAQVVYTFLVDGEDESINYTYQQLEKRAKAIAAYLQRHSQPGDRVLLLYPSSLEYCAAFFACLYAGLIAIPAYPPKRKRSPSRLLNIYRDAQPTLALGDRTILTQIEQYFPSASQLHYIDSESISDSLISEWQNPQLNLDDLAVLQYTSGSTGKPKGVMLSHANLLCNLQLIYTHFGNSPNSKGVTWLPPYHDMGLIGGLLEPIYCGASTVLMSPIAFLQKPLRWLQAISKYQATTSGGPNFAYDLCVQKVNLEALDSLDLSSWEVAFNGAEIIQADTLDRFAKTFAACGFRRSAFYPCYGLAESTLLVAGGHLKKDSDLDTSKSVRVGCGQIVDDHQVVIVNPQTLLPCESGEIGEIWISGKSVARGYWQQPQETSKTFAAQLADTRESQFLRTGDLGIFQAGELFVTGRLKDIIIIRGQNYFPHDLELIVERSHSAIRPYHVAAFSIEQAREERLVIVAEINRRDRRTFDVTEVTQAIRQALSAACDLQVYAISLVKPETLPKTSSGKLQRYLCREYFLNDKLVPLGAWKLDLTAKAIAPKVKVDCQSVESIQEWLVAWLSQKTCVTLTQIDPHTKFTDYGIDSLILIELMESLGQKFNIILDASYFEKFSTISALSQYIATHQQESLSVPQFDLTVTSEIPSEYYCFDRFPEYQALQQQRSQIEALGLSQPFFRPQQSIAEDTIQINGLPLINYATYNYLGLSGDPQITKAARSAIATYGTSVSASRLVSGQIPLHEELETEIARFLGTEKSLVYVGGHATNVTTISHLMGKNDLILYDSLSHNSIIQGTLYSGATAIAFPHNNWQALEQKLAQIRLNYQRVLIAIEGIYSTDGDIPDLPQFIAIKKRYKALLMIDEAHSIGVLGKSGRGISEYFGVNPTEIDICMGTLSKALASCGGYIAGCTALIDYLKYTAPGFVYSVGMSPPNAAAALAALQKLQVESQRITQLQQRANYFLEQAQSRGINTGKSQNSPIIPAILGENDKAIQLSHNLLKRGINVPFMIYPSVPKHQARLRFFVSCLHTESQINTTIDILTEELKKL